ncbi:MAG TPA: hypothetical protein VGF48_18895 [Thermoanaerobaculia bacterium]|jgi:hypothetical protein
MPTKTKPVRAPQQKKQERVVLFPTEPSTIGREKIEAAVRSVYEARLAREKAAAGKS